MMSGDSPHEHCKTHGSCLRYGRCETKLLFHSSHVSIIFSFKILIIFIKTFPFDVFNPELLLFFALN